MTLRCRACGRFVCKEKALITAPEGAILCSKQCYRKWIAKGWYFPPITPPTGDIFKIKAVYAMGDKK